MSALLMTLLLLTGLFLIILVLVQRGRGGGLAGAFGGLGGQSAFGTKAGDLFTRVTIGVATFWILLCLFTVWQLSGTTSRIETTDGAPAGGAATTPANQPGDAPEGDAADEPTGGDATSAPANEQDGAAADDTTGDDTTGGNG